MRIKKFNENFENVSNDDIIKNLKKGISKFGKGEFDVQIIDKRPGKKNKMVKAKSNGEVVSIQNVSESLKDKIKVGLVCTILASGMVSCQQKEGSGFGYNLNVNPVTHDIGKGGTPNKQVNIRTPSGDRDLSVDSTKQKERETGWSGHGVYVKTKPTEAQIIVLRYGTMIDNERRYNNGKGYDADRIFVDVPFKNTELSGDGTLYRSSGESDMEVEDYADYKLGLQSIQDDPDRFERETGLKANDILSRL